jgi:O-antigen/teichoic acid export membrane protein
MKLDLSTILKYLRELTGFSGVESRSQKAKKNIVFLSIFRGLGMLIGYLMVPLTIGYLSQTTYGVWITLTSLVGWLSFFDVGLGHGLKNRFAEAVALNDDILAKKYVSTTYAIIIIIIASFLVLFYLINPFIDWGVILNVSEDTSLNENLNIVATIVFTTFGLTFVLQLINTILNANQQPSKAAFNELLGKALGFIIILILLQTTNGSIVNLSLALSVSPVVVLALVSIFFFNGEYKNYKPTLSYVDFSKTGILLKLSVKFFIIRISAIFLYSTNNIIIAHLLGPAEVAPYSIAISYFNVLFLLFNIVVAPFWSAITEAWVKKETLWIKNTMRKLFYFWIVLGSVGGVMLILSNFVYEIWIGDVVDIPFILSLLVCVWVLITCWNGVYSQFLYGIGAIKIQAVVVIVSAVLNIPLAIFLGSIWGISGILLANIFFAFIQMWIYPLQYSKIINFEAKGLWVK